MELHHCDLGIGYDPADWPTAFATMKLAEPMQSLRQDRLNWTQQFEGAVDGVHVDMCYPEFIPRPAS